MDKTHDLDKLIEDLKKINTIAEALNHADDIKSALNTALARWLEIIGLETGWIFLVDPDSTEHRWGSGYVLAAHHNLPKTLGLDRDEVWNSGCDCQDMCSKGQLTDAYVEVRCSRLATAGDPEGLRVHASAPLCSGNNQLGILNVATKDWSAFDERSLTLLTNAGTQFAIALERAQLYNMIQEKRIDEQAALLNFSNRLLSYTDLEELRDYFIQEVCNLMGADACALLRPGEIAGTLSFRGAYGWRDDPARKSRTAPGTHQSGPGAAMLTQQPILVEDLQKDETTTWLPDWILAEGFRGHAVVPLVAEGRSIGALVINYRHPKLLDEDDLRFLKVMANQAAIAIESVRLHAEELERQRMEKELAVGRQIQLSLLPEAGPSIPGWEIAANYKAARQVGGDFYDFFVLSHDPYSHGFVIADVTDKGVPAAIFMAMCRTMIRTTAFSHSSPSLALTKANGYILNDSRADLFLSAFYGTLDSRSGIMRFANAGHNPPFLLDCAGGEVREYRAHGTIIGAFDEIALEDHELTVQPGDYLLLYTDGLTEAAGDDGDIFGEDRLKQVLMDNNGASADEMIQAILDAIGDFTRNMPQSDDLTMVVLHRVAID